MVVREGRANLQRGAETVGGRLFLTDRRLIFESHKLNVQKGPTVLGLDEIESVEKAWTKFLGVVPLAPNSLAVRTRGGSEHRLVLPRRADWLEALQGDGRG
ncbi:MAG: GRAM domain-containing protein [Actinomycetota bacterium]|nr:GRAM domain-containing protein [Actinomycetota bacterium]